MSQGRRIQFIDSARGIAMLFVLLSHFGFTFFPNQSDRLPTIMRYIGMVASPSFVLINGILVGFLCRVRSYTDYQHLRTVFIDRALFLLTIGHLLLLGSHAPAYTLRFFCITDTIAICLLISPFLARKLSATARVWTGLVAYAVSGLILGAWHPHTAFGAIVEETAIGNLHPVVYSYYFPILPWFAVNCLGSALGDVLGKRQLRSDHAGSHRLLARLAVATLSTAFVLDATYLVVKHWHLADSHTTLFRDLITPFQKTPPGPGYLMWYGGLGLLIILGCSMMECTGRLQQLFRRAAQLGEASLFVFILQFYVYLAVILPLNKKLPDPGAWPLYFLVSCVAIILPALYWQKQGYNRLLTVGYRRLRERLDADAAVANTPQYDATAP
jgi:uncharacterized membrane protein